MYFHAFALAALSIGSVFGTQNTIVGSDPKILNSAICAVTDTKTAVDNEVAIAKNLVHNTVNDEVVPALKASLDNICTEIETLVQFITPLVTGVVLPLAQQELSDIPDLVENVKCILADVEVAVDFILTNLSQGLLLLVKDELLSLLAAIDPIVKPVIQFANSAVTGTSSSESVAIVATIGSIQDIEAEIQGPINKAICEIN